MKLLKISLISVVIGLIIGSPLLAGKITQKEALERAKNTVQAQLGGENKELLDPIRNEIIAITQKNDGLIEEHSVDTIIENALVLHVEDQSHQDFAEEELAAALSLSEQCISASLKEKKGQDMGDPGYDLTEIEKTVQENADYMLALALEQNDQETHPALPQHQAPKLDVNTIVLQANKQKNATCGCHAAINAKAIQDVLNAGQPITAQNIQNQAKTYLGYIIKQTNNLWDNELINFAQKINLRHIQDFYLLHIDEHGSIKIPYNDTAAVYSALQNIKTTNKNLIHCICHMGPTNGGHWVLISIIKEPGKAPYLRYLDSVNGQVKPGSAPYKLIEFVYNATIA